MKIKIKIIIKPSTTRKLKGNAVVVGDQLYVATNQFSLMTAAGDGVSFRRSWSGACSHRGALRTLLVIRLVTKTHVSTNATAISAHRSSPGMEQRARRAVQRLCYTPSSHCDVLFVSLLKWALHLDVDWADPRLLYTLYVQSSCSGGLRR